MRGGRIRRILAAAALAAITAATAAGASAAYTFSPYVDFTGDPVPNLVMLHRDAGVRQISLGFVTASSNNRCAPRWAGVPSLAVSGPHAFEHGNVEAFRSGGGGVVVSFGGAAGTELAVACHSAAAARTAYAAPIAAYRPTRVDFDIEGATIADHAATARRDRAIAALERANRGLRVSFTLPVLPTGLDPDGLAVLRDAIRHRVALSYINLMTMDYGDDAAPRPSGRMGAYAIAAARAAAQQIAQLYPHMSATARRRHIGLTPMIGRNDVSTEVFGLGDAKRLATYARTNGLGLISMWALGRDRACPTPITAASDTCSGVAQAPFAFAAALTG